MSNDPMHPLPPEGFSGKNLSDEPAILVVTEYGVFEWCRAKNGEGKPEMVVLKLGLGADLDGLSILLRLKTRAETNRLIAMLERHRDNVWPLPKGAANG